MPEPRESDLGLSALDAMDMREHAHPYLEEVDALGPQLVSTADNISARLGYRREDGL